MSELNFVGFATKFRLGQEVTIIAIATRAIVRQILVSGDGMNNIQVQFECVWFASGARNKDWFSSLELSEINETSPPKMGF
jgi:hypothetical protein